MAGVPSGLGARLVRFCVIELHARVCVQFRGYAVEIGVVTQLRYIRRTMHRCTHRSTLRGGGGGGGLAHARPNKAQVQYASACMNTSQCTDLTYARPLLYLVADCTKNGRP